MKKMIRNNQEGQGMLEYMILVACVVVIGVASVKAIGTTIQSRLKDAKEIVAGIQDKKAE